MVSNLIVFSWQFQRRKFKFLAIQAKTLVIITSADGTGVQTQQKEVLAIPYYTWANRGKNQMQVWLLTKVKDVRINSGN